MHILSTTPFKSRKLKCLPAKEEIAMDFQNSEGSEAEGIAPSTSEGKRSALEAESTTTSVEKLDKVEEGSSVGVREEEEQNVKKKMNLYLYLAAFWAVFWRKVKSLWASEWLSWLPLWRQNKLERLLAEADANPRDASKQSALLAELNKHSPHAVIKRFEQGEHAADSRAVAEYLKALVATNLITEYLPDEQSAKPAGLPALLLELKQRASGNIDEPFFNPGMSEKHPLHVVMVDPKTASKSTRMVQELVQTIFFYDCI